MFGSSRPKAHWNNFENKAPTAQNVENILRTCVSVYVLVFSFFILIFLFADPGAG